ncbi:MAG: hypothetical protein HKK67_10480 [Chlorobiaceae bacterium]|nr:hypothetical protein [Chlorobiaceae bacterium]
MVELPYDWRHIWPFLFANVVPPRQCKHCGHRSKLILTVTILSMQQKTLSHLAAQSGAIDCKRFVVTPILFRPTALPMSVVSRSNQPPSRKASRRRQCKPSRQCKQAGNEQKTRQEASRQAAKVSCHSPKAAEAKAAPANTGMQGAEASKQAASSCKLPAEWEKASSEQIFYCPRGRQPAAADCCALRFAQHAGSEA